MSNLRREWLFSIIIGVICLFLLSVNLFQVRGGAPNGLHGRGLITAVDNSRVHMSLIVKTEDRKSVV